MSLVPTNNFATVDNYSVFYREAGPVDAPVVLLLHGFPSSSHQYRNLIPILATCYHVIAPDYPGYGFTTTPEVWNHTFAEITSVVSGLLDFLCIVQFAMYIFDYGAPVGFRLALQDPSRITAIVSQNGNAYTEGLGAFWDPVKVYWDTNSTSARQNLTFLASFNTTESQYTTGAPDPSALAPEAWWLDWTLLNRPGIPDTQLDILYDYRTNVAQYPQWQQYLRDHQPPLYAIWGKNDGIFIPPGAEAFKRDLDNVTVQLIDAGHFALESSLDEISNAILPFLNDHLQE